MNHDITLIGEHSVCLDLIQKNGYVLDAGCRGFDITNFFEHHEKHPVVINCDIDDLPGSTHELIEGDGEQVISLNSYITRKRELPFYFKCGIANYNGYCQVRKTHDPQGHYLDETLTSHEQVRVLTTEAMRKVLGIRMWDLIKLDIEGSEYGILDYPGPIAKQVSVEFHEHTDRGIGKQKLDELLDHLEKWYTIYNRNWESRHGAGFNYWDVLLIVKPEIIKS